MPSLAVLLDSSRVAIVSHPCLTTTTLGRGALALFRQRPLKRLGFAPRRAHPLRDDAIAADRLRSAIAHSPRYAADAT
jgi:hypothetical protein